MLSPRSTQAGSLLIAVEREHKGKLLFAGLLGMPRVPPGWERLGQVVVAAILVLVLGGALFAVRSFRRMAAPIGDLMAALGRVADGDNAARVAYWAANPARIGLAESSGLVAVPFLIGSFAVVVPTSGFFRTTSPGRLGKLANSPEGGAFTGSGKFAFSAK